MPDAKQDTTVHCALGYDRLCSLLCIFSSLQTRQTSIPFYYPLKCCCLHTVHVAGQVYACQLQGMSNIVCYIQNLITSALYHVYDHCMCTVHCIIMIIACVFIVYI